jgi:cobalt-zinc-cadmium efflux system membrane fusion protein
MNKKQSIAVGVVLALGAALVLLILTRVRPAGTDSAHDHHGDETEAPETGVTVEKGPHGGRLLRDGETSLEVTIFERGVPPQFRVYSYHKNQPLDPATLQLTMELKRLGGRVDQIRFKPEAGYLVGDQTVYEPHSFDVTVDLQASGRTHRWQYASYEARVELAPEAAKNAGVVVETVGPATIRGTLQVNGRILPNEEQLKHVVPRYPGVLREVRRRLGDAVGRDEVLAVVESNESLQRYEVKSELAGTVIAKHAAPGEFVGEGEAIFVVADLSSVWVDLNIYRQDAARVQAGQAVRIDGGDGSPPADGRIAYVSPFGAENTQTLLARVILPNPQGQWRPGLFVTGEILFEETVVPLAVKAAAIQTLRDWTVVFINEGSFYEPLVIEPGRRDGDWVEVLSGMQSGQRYVAENSFLLKADILKSGATHDH